MHEIRNGRRKYGRRILSVYIGSVYQRICWNEELGRFSMDPVLKWFSSIKKQCIAQNFPRRELQDIADKVDFKFEQGAW